MTVRSEQKEKRRQEIMDAGLDLFIHRGFSATKISDIAKKAGMSMGLLFHYFKSKEHLYEELIRYGISGPNTIMSGDISDPLEFFQNSAEQIFEYASKEPTIAKMFILMKQAAYNDAAPESVKKLLKDDNAIRHSAGVIKAGQQAGTIRDGDPGALAVAFWAAVQGVCEELALHPCMPCPDANWIVDIIRRKQ